jgi:phospholipase/carboxylesterase
MSFHHVTIPGSGRTILALHGTGGDEHDLVPLVQAVDPNATIISPRGKVTEYGSNRFFKRLAEGVFDLEDLALRTDELADWIASQRIVPLALGFSNGANIAASILLRRPEILAGAILIRAMVPFEPGTAVDGVGKPILILSGERDPIVPMDNARRLAELLTQSNFAVTHKFLPTGHNLTQADILTAQEWLG